MSYEYTDMDGAPLKINSFQGGRVGNQVYIRAGRDGTYVKPEDAPAVALAVLEAAGIDVAMHADFVVDPDECAGKAMWWLRRHIGKQAEREAEDAKAKAYRDALFPNAVKWEHLDEEIREAHRKRYRAAREFFAKEDTPAPRVLQYGDPEPDANTEWKTSSGHQIWNNGRGWLYYTSHEVTPWSSFTRGAFPMTEVTGDAR